MNQMNRRPPASRQRGIHPRAVQRRTKSRRNMLAGRSGSLPAMLVMAALVIVLAFLLQSKWQNGFPLEVKGGSADQAVKSVPEIYTQGSLRINELMSSNRKSFVPAKDQSPDWIELMNTGKASINLKGWSLAKSEHSSNVFTFPDMELQPGACTLIAADGILRTDASELLHAPFRLSLAGDSLMLFNASGAAVDSVNIPTLAADHAYVREDNSTWTVSSMPTPGMPNTQEGYQALHEPDANSPILLTELMPDNAGAYRDDQNRVFDYLKIYNRSAAPVSLADWGLSDHFEDPFKWSFPDVRLEAGETMIIYAVGRDGPTPSDVQCARFSMNPEGEQLVLTAPNGKMMDCVRYGYTPANTAWTRMDDGSWTSGSASSASVGGS